MEGYLSSAEGAALRDEFFKLFLTAKEMGTTVDVTFTHRDANQNKVQNAYTDVLVTLADRQSAKENFESAIVVATQGQLSREVPFAPVVGATFTIRGKSGRVAVVYPELNRIVRADVVFTNPYG